MPSGLRRTHRRGINNCHSFHHFFLVRLGAGAVEVADDRRHAGLVAQRGGQVDRLLRVILGEAGKELASTDLSSRLLPSSFPLPLLRGLTYDLTRPRWLALRFLHRLLVHRVSWWQTARSNVDAAKCVCLSREDSWGDRTEEGKRANRGEEPRTCGETCDLDVSKKRFESWAASPVDAEADATRTKKAEAFESNCLCFRSQLTFCRRRVEDWW